MRGAHHIGIVFIPWHGIIPADAGSTWPEYPSRGDWIGSSPRMRGALSQIPDNHPSYGSSPRMRGAR